MSKYIIGGGVAGLIAAFYNKDYKVLTDSVGGQFNSFCLGPRILEVDENSTNLLKDLNITNYSIKTAKIGYKVNGITVDSINEKYRLMYYLKSRRLRQYDEVPESVMSGGKNEIQYYDINWKEFFEKITEDLNIKNERLIKKIDTKNQTITFIKHDNPYTIEYLDLISTLPAPIFYNVSDLQPKENLKYLSKFFVKVKSKSIDIKDYDYIYYPESKYDFHRITKIDDEVVCIEYTNNHFRLSETSIVCRLVLNTYRIPIGQIVSGEVSEIENVKFLGRFAEWNHGIKINNIIQQTRK